MFIFFICIYFVVVIIFCYKNDRATCVSFLLYCVIPALSVYFNMQKNDSHSVNRNSLRPINGLL